MSKPLGVAISDIHFTVQNLELCSTALRSALIKAEALGVPLNILGDLHEHKAIIRAEVMNRIIQILKPAEVPIRILVGNHDLCNEKGVEHGLTYLKPFATVINNLTTIEGTVYLPYQNDGDNIKQIVKDYFRKGDIIFMHQGVRGACVGEYTQDKTSIDVSILKDFKVISGHYHRHQTIGTLTYIGSPFTMSFGEASDGPKGYLVVYEDGSFKREILNLRKHVIVDVVHNNGSTMWSSGGLDINDNDLVWLKARGSKHDFVGKDKKYYDDLLGLKNYKLDKIIIEDKIVGEPTKKLTDLETLYSLIGQASNEQHRNYLMSLASEVLACE